MSATLNNNNTTTTTISASPDLAHQKMDIKKPQQEPSLYDALGGAKAVELAVDIFYTRVLADSRVSRFFEGIDMNRQRRMQIHFLTFAFGGAYNYNGRNMRAAHKRLVEKQGLNDSHFDTIVELLGGTLRELGVAEHLIGQVAAKCEAIRDDILCREPATTSSDKTKPIEATQPTPSELSLAKGGCPFSSVCWQRVAVLSAVAVLLLAMLLIRPL